MNNSNDFYLADHFVVLSVYSVLVDDNMLTDNGLVVEHKEQIVPMESIDNLPRVSCKGHNMFESMWSSGGIDGMNTSTARKMATILCMELVR